MRHLFDVTGIIILAAVLLTASSCKPPEEQNVTRLKQDHEEITKILDRAMLSDAPVDSFKAAFERVKKYPSVDSVWISGVSFFIKYKQGGIVSWTVPPKPINP
jgi:hypothetical protein